ncbi:LOW QUALITY PROTEIN: hypothetical protein KUTeg_007375 [Tegillarca granosa]|uniref:Uncharacterized protein n=1 Tax=Tegillarca granosa TaxID=220873 RepID=A0ABQ9FHS5_TEGGR|nr:LOW QUALITY PROTEIN: hypothetical protein KUTeg_007375 [Tegillarca granosa]
MRAQSYDDAAAMSGKHRGVKARIRQQKFVHCKPHCLNLAIVHASNDLQERLQRSTKLSVKRVGPVVQKRYPPSSLLVIHALEYLHDNGDEEEGQHLASIIKFYFLIALVVAKHVLGNTVPLSIHVQAVDCDFLVALNESRTIVRQFQNERADPDNDLYDIAVDLGTESEALPWMPRLAQRQRNRAYTPSNSLLRVSTEKGHYITLFSTILCRTLPICCLV